MSIHADTPGHHKNSPPDSKLPIPALVMRKTVPEDPCVGATQVAMDHLPPGVNAA